MKKTKMIISILLLIFVIPILFFSTVILVDSYRNPNEIPSFFGWKPFIVLSGSMESEIFPGDVVVVKEVSEDQLKENDIIAFKEDNFVVTHRIVKIEEVDGEKRYITKGDNNNSLDANYVTFEEVEGLYQFKISGIGNFALFLQTPIGMAVGLSIPILILILIQMKESKDEKKLLKAKLAKEQDLLDEIERLKKQNDNQ